MRRPNRRPWILAAIAATILAADASGAAIEDFESFTPGDQGFNIDGAPGWSGMLSGNPANRVDVRQTSIAGTSGAGGVGYGGGQGLEFAFQKSVRREFARAESISSRDAGAVEFVAKLRIASIRETGSQAAENHSFALVLGENIGWERNDGSLHFANANGFVVMFYNADGLGSGHTSIRISHGAQGFNLVTDNVPDFTTVPTSQWAFDTWYTVRLSGFDLQDTPDDGPATAVLHISESESGTPLIDGLHITANTGSPDRSAGAFDQIDSLSLSNVRGNGLVGVDDIGWQRAGSR